MNLHEEVEAKVHEVLAERDPCYYLVSGAEHPRCKYRGSGSHIALLTSAYLFWYAQAVGHQVY